MSIYNTTTNTTTYTVLDIRKTFEGFDADLKMIARRTEKWTVEYAEKIFHDILKLAESKYIQYIDITLLDVNRTPIRACRFTIEENGNASSSDRAGGNDWPNIPNTSLAIIIGYNAKWRSLTLEQREQFGKDSAFKIDWITSTIDNSYSNLTKNDAQLFASKGYEVKKINYK